MIWIQRQFLQKVTKLRCFAARNTKEFASKVAGSASMRLFRSSLAFQEMSGDSFHTSLGYCYRSQQLIKYRIFAVPSSIRKAGWYCISLYPLSFHQRNLPWTAPNHSWLPRGFGAPRLATALLPARPGSHGWWATGRLDQNQTLRFVQQNLQSPAEGYLKG